ncbi:hypothetical protein H9P43_008145 [Blastocladiella emersonii ATCC 22665]|nr:hypothetical protein H9P43_008145 [Blastocladiella emersonii ATCC 22665]
MVLSGRLRYAAGIVALLCVVLLWVGSSFLINFTFSEQNYHKPALVTFINTASFSLYLVPVAIRAAFRSRRRASKSERGAAAIDDVESSPAAAAVSRATTPVASDTQPLLRPPTATPSVSTGQSYATFVNDELAPPPPPSSVQDDLLSVKTSATRANSPVSGAPSVVPVADEPAEQQTELPPLTTYETAKLSFQFCGLWFFANYSTNVSLGMTNVASTTILSSMSGPLTLLLASYVGADSFTAVKFAAAVCSFIGVVCVASSDGGSGAVQAVTDAAHPVLGDLLSLVGAVFYAVYITWLKVKIGHESRLRMSVFFGCLGMCNILMLLPFLGLLHVTGLEPFAWPDQQVWGVLLVNALLGTFVSDYLWLLSMLMTGPTVVTLGLSLTIPVAMVGDLVLKGISYPPSYLLGAALIVLGFLGANLELDTLEARFRGLLARWRRGGAPEAAPEAEPLPGAWNRSSDDQHAASP